MQGEKCKYSVMRHKGRSTKETAPGREGKEEQVEVAVWLLGTWKPVKTLRVAKSNPCGHWQPEQSRV